MEETKITSLLIRLGVAPDKKGFRYLVQAIRLWGESDEEKPALGEIYPAVGEMYGAHWTRVERNIRRAIDDLGTRVPFEDAVKILGTRAEAYPDGFTNGQFIALCALRIGGTE